MNLFDMMSHAGGGNGFAQLARQYGVSEDQIGKAVQAFLPAFSAGLKRSTADPFGFVELMRKLATGGYPQAYQSPAWAFGAGLPQGQEAVNFLFGSPEAARAVAAQASAFTGLAQSKLDEMLPALAAMMFGGLAGEATSVNPLLDFWMKQARSGAGAPAGEAPAGKGAEQGPLDRYESEQAERAGDFARVQGEAMKSGLAAFQAGTAAWTQAVGDMMKAAGGGRAAADAAHSETPPSGRAAFGDLFEPGIRVGEAYQREMEAILDRFRPDAARR